MRNNAKTIGFEQQIRVNARSLHYRETSVLDIYGKIVRHRDENGLEPRPN